ncbi:hypothetical protein CDAR_584781 [Caerostris darwini]|uniref:Uncharacterized protein n=1 Tax=Caerostris darwini TaxID=1538125 RepID=A0AAV4QQH9_9ARAC|nr:hypothetical protein CDAR_584781 [Caerostris darwini]
MNEARENVESHYHALNQASKGVSHISAWFRHAIPANTKHALLPDKELGTHDGRLRRLKTAAFLGRQVIRYSVEGVPQMSSDVVRLITKDSDYAGSRCG